MDAQVEVKPHQELDVDRSLGLLRFPAPARTSVASSWFRHRRSCFFTEAIRFSVPTSSLGATDLSLCPSAAARVDTTSSQTRFLEIVKLTCCDVHLYETASRPLGTTGAGGVDDCSVAASVVPSRGAPGGVVGERLTVLFPLCVMFASRLLVFWSK